MIIFQKKYNGETPSVSQKHLVERRRVGFLVDVSEKSQKYQLVTNRLRMATVFTMTIILNIFVRFVISVNRKLRCKFS